MVDSFCKGWRDLKVDINDWQPLAMVESKTWFVMMSDTGSMFNSKNGYYGLQSMTMIDMKKWLIVSGRLTNPA